jgi:hypothetical protein
MEAVTTRPPPSFHADSHEPPPGGFPNSGSCLLGFWTLDFRLLLPEPRISEGGGSFTFLVWRLDTPRPAVPEIPLGSSAASSRTFGPGLVLPLDEVRLVTLAVKAQAFAAAQCDQVEAHIERKQCGVARELGEGHASLRCDQ